MSEGGEFYKDLVESKVGVRQNSNDENINPK
jgi:hypothetical protein